MKFWCLAVLVAAGAPAAVRAETADARALYQSRRFTEAEVIFRQKAVAHPRDAEAIYYLGKIAIRLGDYAAATRYLERAVALAPNESDYHVWLGNAYAWAANAAPLCDKATLGRKIPVAYQKALEFNPDNLSAHIGLMNFYRHVPALLGGGMTRARAEADAICRRDRVRGALAMTTLDAQEKNFRTAFARLDELLPANSGNYAAHCALGRLALASGDRLDDGAAAFERCLDLTPDENDEGHEFALWGLGQIAEMKHEIPSACHAYEIAVKLNPRFKPAAEALAKLQATPSVGS